MAKRDYLEETLDKAGGLDLRLSPNDTIDAGLKLASTAATIIAGKFILDQILTEDMMKWAQKYGQAMSSMLEKMGPMFYLTGNLGPIAAVVKTVADDPQVKADLEDSLLSYVSGFTAGLGQMGIQALGKMAGIILIHDADIQKAVVQAVQSGSDAENRLAALNSNIGQIDLQIARIQTDIIRGGDENRIEETKMLEKRLGELRIERARLDGLRKEQIDIINRTADAELKAEKGRARALEVLKWSMAIIAGLIVSATMIYAGDSVYDLIGGALKSLFVLPIGGA